MWRKRWLFLALVGVLVLLGGAYLAALRYGRHLAGASVTVVGHESRDGMLIISVVMTNTGRTPLVYHGHPPGAEVRVERVGGWTNVSQGSFSKTASYGFVLPGRSLSYRFKVPQDVSRVQVGCYFTTDGAKAWAAGKLLEVGWRNRLYWVWDFILPLLPEGRQEVVEFWSPETNVR